MSFDPNCLCSQADGRIARARSDHPFVAVMNVGLGVFSGSITIRRITGIGATSPSASSERRAEVPRIAPLDNGSSATDNRPAPGDVASPQPLVGLTLS